MLKRCFHDNYEEKWSGDLELCTEESNKKLRTYKDFKEVLKFELYLTIENPKYRIAISKLRMSAHSLAIETGRHKSQSPSDRLCSTCNVPGTEIHHVMFCSKFDNLRTKLFAVCKKEIRHFDKLRSDERRFCKIMELNTIPLANALGQYLTKAM